MKIIIGLHQCSNEREERPQPFHIGPHNFAYGNLQNLRHTMIQKIYSWGETNNIFIASFFFEKFANTSSIL